MIFLVLNSCWAIGGSSVVTLRRFYELVGLTVDAIDPPWGHFFHFTDRCYLGPTERWRFYCTRVAKLFQPNVNYIRFWTRHLALALHEREISRFILVWIIAGLEAFTCGLFFFPNHTTVSKRFVSKAKHVLSVEGQTNVPEVAMGNQSAVILVLCLTELDGMFKLVGDLKNTK